VAGLLKGSLVILSQQTLTRRAKLTLPDGGDYFQRSDSAT
jgi:hypothetical protein